MSFVKFSCCMYVVAYLALTPSHSVCIAQRSGKGAGDADTEEEKFRKQLEELVEVSGVIVILNCTMRGQLIGQLARYTWP